MDQLSPTDNLGSSKPKSNKKNRLTARQKKLALCLVAILLVAAGACGIYKLGYNKGHDAGYKTGKEAGEKSVKNSSDIFKSIQSPFNTLTGVVENIDGDNLTIDTSKGERQTVKLTDKTKITKKTDTLKRDALNKGTKVTIFTQGKDKDLSATRIVVR